MGVTSESYVPVRFFYNFSTHVRLYIGSKRDRTRAHRTAARPARVLDRIPWVDRTFIFHFMKIYRGATGNHNATIPHAGPGDILH
jgi:hypothetical protein